MTAATPCSTISTERHKRVVYAVKKNSPLNGHHRVLPSVDEARLSAPFERKYGSAASDADDTVVSADVDLPQSTTPPPTSALRAGLENSCNTPSCQADFLPCRASVMPDSGSDHGAASHGGGGGADYAGRHAARSGILQGPTLPGPLHPCHAAFLSCRLSARPPIRDSEQEQPHGTWHQRCRATAGKWAQLWGDASHLTLLLATQGLEPPPSDVRWVCAGACTHLFLGALARRAAQRARAHGTILLWSSAHLRDAEIALCLILTFQARLPGGRESSLLGVGGT